MSAIVEIAWQGRPAVTFTARLPRPLYSSELALLANLVELIEEFRDTVSASDGQAP